MQTFHELYEKLLRQAVQDDTLTGSFGEADPHHLDCLLNPDNHPPVWRIGNCCCAEKAACLDTCSFDALKHDTDGNAVIDWDNCVGCNACIEHCTEKILVGRKDILPVLELLRAGNAPVYAMIAPAFISQFSDTITPGMLRSAFKRIGFSGMIEVALFADILTLKEAFEFDRHIKSIDDFQLTSCCCPIWIAMIRKNYHLLVTHIPPSVSPMAACGRSIKQLYPGAMTVFIGPCIAKKSEAKEPDIRDAVDHVLTFQEIWDIFQAAGIDPAACEEDLRDHSSASGRKYARVGGVSEAVQETVNRLSPDRTIPLQSAQGDGTIACKALLAKLMDGGIAANFIEGMGCVGGCVGGPRALIDKEIGTRSVDRYSKEAAHETPIDNPYVLELLHRLGFDSVESLLEGENLFTRVF